MSQQKKAKSTSKVDKSNAEEDFRCLWGLIDVLSEKVNWCKWALENTVQLLDDGNTVPFIARYRKEQTKTMEAEKIREVKEQLDYLRTVQSKAANVYKAVAKLGKVTPEWKQALALSQSLDDVEHLYAPYKPGSKGTLAERAKELGLEPFAMKLITPPGRANLQEAVKPNIEGLSCIEDIKKGVQHILADVISKNHEIMKAVREWCKSAPISLKCTQVKTTNNAKSKTDGRPQARSSKNVTDASKFELYFDFCAPIRNIRPHQILAINRGMSKKVLSTKIVIPDYISKQLLTLASRKFIPQQADGSTRELVTKSIQDAYTRLIEPLMMRHFKSELNKMAEKASIDVFAANLKKLLLMPPVRGHVILGVDPGFKHGCKYAVISVTGQVLDTGVFYPHTQFKSGEVGHIRNVIIQNRCEIVGIGNGTACRETESFFAEHIKQGTFRPLNVKFCIVNESGASIYSASPEAAKELPDLDVSLRGAVSIARRLQDPLAELVKIEPKHIGVGMYQHDVSDSRLKTALDGVVEDCVNFVGVDLNVASEALLKHIAGLTATTAKNILKHRDSNGVFTNREQLTTIKGLGPKAYKQCAGFIRILSTNGKPSSSKESDSVTVSGRKRKDDTQTTVSGRKRKDDTQTTGQKSKKRKVDAIKLEPNPLDMTSIHPESYHVADRVLSLAGVTRDHIGSRSCIDAIKSLTGKMSLDTLSTQLDVGVPTLSLILEALQQEIGHDIRDEFEKPLFRDNVRQLCDLKIGDQLTGRVTNMVHFGAFVDVGVGRDGLIHCSQINPQCLNGKRSLELGDKVEVCVTSLDLNRGRLGLRLEKLG